MQMTKYIGLRIFYTGEYIKFSNPEKSVKQDAVKWHYQELWICLKSKVWTLHNIS